MMDLLAKAKISKEDAEILMKANKIIIEANAKVRPKWDKRAIELRLLFEDTCVKSHVNGFYGD
jgi:hypothetical protein